MVTIGQIRTIVTDKVRQKKTEEHLINNGTEFYLRQRAWHKYI